MSACKTPHAQTYDIMSGHIILETSQPDFALNYPLCADHLELTRGLQLPI